MSETTFIYALKEPDTGEIRYIGQSGDPQDRFRQHCRTKEKCHRGNWIRALKKSGQKPILEIVDEALYEFRDPIEAAYVQFFREQGCNLVNGTPGGDGCGKGGAHPSFGMKHSPEALKKIGDASRGEKNPFFGKRHTPESIEAMSLATRGSNHPNFGKNLSQETKNRIGDAQRGKKGHRFGKPAWNRGKKKGVLI